MENLESMRWLEALSSAGFALGPFFFSILFMLVIARTAQSCYAKVNERTTPPATAEEKQVYRLYFLACVGCGILLVFLSVGWWMYAQLQKHTFEGVIHGLEPTQVIAPSTNDIYYREVTRSLVRGKEVHDYHFAIVRNAPFTNGQPFTFKFYPESGSIGDKQPDPINLVIRYQAGPKPPFELRREGDTYLLKPVS